MVEVPPVTPVATPAALVVATEVLEDDQVTWLVMFCVLLSLKVPVAVNACVPPAVMVGLVGVTAIEVSVAAGANTTSTQ